MVLERLKTRYWAVLSPLPRHPLMVTHLALYEQVKASLIRFALLERGQVSPRGEDGNGICLDDVVVRGHAKVGMLVVEKDGLAGGAAPAVVHVHSVTDAVQASAGDDGGGKGGRAGRRDVGLAHDLAG